MKSTIMSGILIVLALLVTSGSAQNPNGGEQRLLALIKEVEAQQAAITANQEKIDTKMAEVNETVRVARIFAGRGGK